MKIILVDDDTFLRDMYATKFIECGHEVEAFDHGSKALESLKKDNDYNVVLVDMIMPGMSGIELIKNIQKEKLLNKSIFIVLSNQGQQADVDEALDAGAQSYIIKSEHLPSEVVKKVEQILKDS